MKHNNEDKSISKSASADLLKAITILIGAYILICHGYQIGILDPLITKYNIAGYKPYFDQYNRDEYLLLAKFLFLIMATITTVTDDFHVKRKVVTRYEKKSISSLNQELIVLITCAGVLLCLPIESKFSVVLLVISICFFWVNRDYFILLAFRFPKHKAFFLKSIKAQWHDTENKDINADGYHSIRHRENIINAPIIGHHNKPLFFYHKVKKGSGVEVIYNGNPRRGNGVIGTAGSGKTYSVLDPMAIQTIRDLKIPLAEYDFKFPNMTRVAFNQYIKSKSESEKKNQKYPVKFACTTFSREFLHNTFRINPLSNETILDELDSDMYMKTFFQCLNPDWIKKEDFWAKSAFAYGSATSLAFQRYCPNFTFAHILQFLSMDYERQVRCLINLDDDQISAKIENVKKPILENKGADQITGIFSTIQNSTSQMNNRFLFYAVSGDDASLDLNNPSNPYQLCIGNSNKYKGIFSPIISLYYTIIFNLCNNLNRLPLHVLIDEAATLNLVGVEDFINTGRSNNMITTLGFQGLAQSDFMYGEQLARVIMTSLGNWYYGQTNDGKAIDNVVKMMGQYKFDDFNKSRGQRIDSSSISSSKQTEKFIRYEEVTDLDQGYFIGKMAEGEHKKFMGMYDVEEFEPIMKEGESQILPLSPSVHKLYAVGDISKDVIAQYYQGNEKAAQKINQVVDSFAESEYQRIKQETELFLIGQH